MAGVQVSPLDANPAPGVAVTTPVPPQVVLRRMFDAAVASALPELCVPPALPLRPSGRTIVVGAGKAAAAMARAVEANWDGPLSGLVITRYGHAVPCRQIEVVEARHPVPDEAGVQATERLCAHLQGLSRDDLVIALISGGGSALLTAPPPGVPLIDEQQLVSSLLKSGATISEMNCVRKHLSAVKGGRLALAAAPARVVTLIISDVPGDDPSTIASGPTVPDSTTRQEALEILTRYDLAVPGSILKWLGDPASETPKPGSFESQHHMIATPQMALEAAAAVALDAGYAPLIIGSAIEGEAREIAKMHAGIAHQVQNYGQPSVTPCVLISGGETTVTVTGKGRGGRNAEFLLALAVALNGASGIHAIAADTDGIDGTEDNAGAIIGPDILQRGSVLGISAAQSLGSNNAYQFFKRTDSLVMTGATMTNVNDFRAILIDGSRG
ncbi:glycerate kinase [Sphingobium sp. SCG-1]|uniref:glycerate kinase type-2 family protein n=1 Tax=Sphingobium sp. SCG-1 TaxID=2072936 RepID=UPI000CD69B12|nr:glycerate kinase [Sphingobium sp. SCG-1]AUW57005.1 glycerate kinase [Sphingobium sp. SCG-1]